MEDLGVVDSINNAGSWLVRNQALLISYAVNIAAAIANYSSLGMDCCPYRFPSHQSRHAHSPH